MATTTIVFSDIAFKERGRVTIADGKFEGDTPFAKRFVYDAEYKRQSPEDFIEYFSNWSNGRYWSEIAK